MPMTIHVIDEVAIQDLASGGSTCTACFPLRIGTSRSGRSNFGWRLFNQMASLIGY